MSQHVPDDLLQSFVDAEVDEQLACHIAEHLDACPFCATRAAGLEPLGAAFAAVRDPLPPADLAARILAQVDRPDRRPVAEIVLGTALLLSASVLTVLGLDNPWTFAVDAGSTVQAAATLARGLALALGPFQVALGITAAVALAGGLLTLRFAAAPTAELGAANELRRAP
ncbi:MAG: hypothetical protein ABMA64_18435 [Myxococcota bacterium]